MPSAPTGLRIRFWTEAILASITAFLAALTLFWHDWIEAFGLDPDHGNGTVEWLVVGGLLAGTVAAAALARVEWRRAALETT